MAKLASLPEKDVIAGFKGVIDYYVRDGVPIVRKWPRPHRPSLTPQVIANQQAFADAVALWNTLDPSVQAAYNAMASGSTMSGRDMMVKMYLNGKSILPY
jgi:hypothetical protein